MESLKPTNVNPLLGPLHAHLMEVLRDLSPAEWSFQTLAPEWSIRDVAAHLLDGYLRTLSVLRDHYRPTSASSPTGYAGLVELINRQNREWIEVSRRLSSGVLIDLLAVAGPTAAQTLSSLDPAGSAVFSVAWADETESENWMHVGREYTEQWHHQAQIRVAADRPGLFEPQWFGPLTDLSVRALPRAYRDTEAEPGSTLTLEVPGSGAGPWTLTRVEAEWVLALGRGPDPAVIVRMEPGLAWRVFYNAVSEAEAMESAEVEGDADLARPLFATRSVMV